MQRVFSQLLAGLLASLSAGCTFYTACPTGTGATQNNGGGSGAGASGAGTGGTGNAGGSVGMGGTVAGNWVNTTSNLAKLDSECGNMSFVSAKPDEDLLIAGVAVNGLWGSRDGGDSWTQLGTGAGSDMIINRTSAIIYDPTDSNKFWESGIYGGPGAYVTTDDGATFSKLGNVIHTDLLSVDLGDPERKTLLAGGHEQAQTLNLSTDGGKTWMPIGSKLPSNSYCNNPLVIDANNLLTGCTTFASGPTGIYLTTDSGGSWTSLTTSGGAGTPLRASDGSIYWASSGEGGMTRSTDGGMTWKDVVGGGVLKSLSPIELPDGRIAALGLHAVVVSADHGATWTEVSPPLPYGDVAGLAYSAPQKSFYVWHFTCAFPAPIPLPADAIMKFAFDYASM
jgi:hypothetical protein